MAQGRLIAQTVVILMSLTKESWIEKYRPKMFDEYVGQDTEVIRKMLKTPREMPHLLFVGKTPGTGKTSLAKIIVKELGADSITINSSKDRTLEVIREKIVKFSSSMSSKRGIPRVVIMDEIDGMPKMSQESLRNVMEEFSAGCKFILTGNNIAKIHTAIQSRCVKIDFKSPPKDLIAQRLKFVITQEKLVIEQTAIDMIIANNYPSMRNMIGELQLLSLRHKEIKAEHIVKAQNKEQQIWALIKAKKVHDVRKLVIEEGLNVEELVNALFVIEEHSPAVIKVFALYAYRLAVGADPEITFAGLATELGEVL